MTSKGCLQTAALTGVLAEAVLALPLMIASPSQMPGPVPAWVWVLARFQEPGASIVLRLLRDEWVKQVAAQFKVAHAIFLLAQGLVMVIQALLFSLVTLGLIYGWQRGHRQQKPSARQA